MIWEDDDYQTVNITLFCGSEPSGGAVVHGIVRLAGSGLLERAIFPPASEC